MSQKESHPHSDQHHEAPAQPESESARPADEASDAPLVDAEAELAAVRQELADATDRLLRARADMDNYRKRAQREMDEVRRYAEAQLVADLLPVLDNIERAIEAASQQSDSPALLEGVRLMYKQLQDVLAAHHCQPIDPLHAPFDPNLHEAILQQPSEEHPPGTVLQVVRRGYQMHQRVLRPAQVIVSKASSQSAET